MKTISSIITTLFLFLLSQPLFSQKGSMMDERDGTVYKTITIGSQTWMAENLNYKTRESWCYDNKEENCRKYGTIYTWTSIMNGQENEKAQGICPKGWHIPSNEEWEIMTSVYQKTKDYVQGGASGFDMLFAGCRFPNRTYDFLEKVATFWTSSADEYNSEFVYTWYAYKDKRNQALAKYSTNKDYGQYLRCIKD